MIRTDPGKFRQLVEESLRRQVAAINKVNVFYYTSRTLFVSDPQES